MRTGTLELGQDPKGPALYVDCETITFPVAVKNAAQFDYLLTLVGRLVTFKPKLMGTHTNATGKPEAILFATEVSTYSTPQMQPTINGRVN